MQQWLLPANQLLCANDELLHGAACLFRFDRLCHGRHVLQCARLDMLCAGPDVLQWDVEWNHGPAAGDDRRASSGACCLRRTTGA